jgi:Type IV secretion system pilin
MKNKLKQVLYSALMTPLLALSVAATVPAVALAAPATCDPNVPANLTLDGGAKCAQGNSQDGSLTNVFKTVVNILLFLVGAIAVIMLVIGGLRYVTSNGDQNAVTGAKNTIMYAIIGIVVAFLAYAAVGFVTSQLQSSVTT